MSYTYYLDVIWLVASISVWLRFPLSISWSWLCGLTLSSLYITTQNTICHVSIFLRIPQGFGSKSSSLNCLCVLSSSLPSNYTNNLFDSTVYNFFLELWRPSAFSTVYLPSTWKYQKKCNLHSNRNINVAYVRF